MTPCLGRGEARKEKQKEVKERRKINNWDGSGHLWFICVTIHMTVILSLAIGQCDISTRKALLGKSVFLTVIPETHTKGEGENPLLMVVL